MNESGNDDHVFAPESLRKLEFEIAELLKSKQGMPVSIASLPTMYLEKYGKMLQADGYLTESQRHGKGGLSLTRLLSRLNNSIRIIDRYFIILRGCFIFFSELAVQCFLKKGHLQMLGK